MRTLGKAFIFGLAFAVAGTACGSPSVVGADATLPDADEGDAFDREDSFFVPAETSWDDRNVAPDVNPYEGYDVVDGGPLADGNWAPCNFERSGETHGCCNGEICKGFCEVQDDGGARCSCFGVAGGCGILSVQAFCCTLSRGCEGQPCGPGGK